MKISLPSSEGTAFSKGRAEILRTRLKLTPTRRSPVGKWPNPQIALGSTQVTAAGAPSGVQPGGEPCGEVTAEIIPVCVARRTVGSGTAEVTKVRSCDGSRSNLRIVHEFLVRSHSVWLRPGTERSPPKILAMPSFPTRTI